MMHVFMMQVSVMHVSGGTLSVTEEEKKKKDSDNSSTTGGIKGSIPCGRIVVAEMLPNSCSSIRLGLYLYSPPQPGLQNTKKAYFQLLVGPNKMSYKSSLQS